MQVTLALLPPSLAISRAGASDPVIQLIIRHRMEYEHAFVFLHRYLLDLNLPGVIFIDMAAAPLSKTMPTASPAVATICATAGRAAAGNRVNAYPLHQAALALRAPPKRMRQSELPTHSRTRSQPPVPPSPPPARMVKPSGKSTSSWLQFSGAVFTGLPHDGAHVAPLAPFM